MSAARTVDDLTLEVRPSARRRTLQLTVDRGGELILSAPPGVADDVLRAFVREKRFWLYTKLAEKEALAQPVRAREFVTGEGFPYLGRTYRLLLLDEQDVPLKLSGGRFRMRRSAAASGRETFVRWYTEHAQVWLEKRVRTWMPRLSADPEDVLVRDLGFRWGSCGRGGVVNFHWATILLPVSIVDYVVVHELAHLAERDHGPRFWQIVERAMPDYRDRKTWLATHGGAFATV